MSQRFLRKDAALGGLVAAAASVAVVLLAPGASAAPAAPTGQHSCWSTQCNQAAAAAGPAVLVSQSAR
jgi:hypothetical protein